MPNLLCPYCFEKSPRNLRAFRCINQDALSCKPEIDKQLGVYQRLSVPLSLQRVFTVSSTWFRPPSVAVCSCGIKTTKAVCPHCHNDLPSQFGTTDSHTIALIGAKDAGKSHFIAVLVHELTNRVGYSLNAALNALDDQTTRRYKEDFRRYIYDDRVVIPGTRAARAQGSVRYPLIYRFSIERKIMSAFNRLSASCLVFFDTAGEDLNSSDVMATETKYIANSDALIFLLDPLQIPAVRHQLGSSVSVPAVNTDPQEIIGRVTRLIRESRGLGPNERIHTPVALVFSKIDAIRPLVEPGSPIHRASAHNGAFDLLDAEHLNDSMRAYVSAWIGPGFDVTLRHEFDNFRYFGVSALGSSPDQDGNLPIGVSPFRVEDPFLWLLYEMGVIPGRKE